MSSMCGTTANYPYDINAELMYRTQRTQGRVSYFGVPSEGPHTLAGASPAMAKSQSHVAWMAGGDGNVAF